MKPYYEDDTRPCACGCGQVVGGHTRNGPRRFVSGHNLRVIERTDAHRAALKDAAHRVWRSKREPKPAGHKHKTSSGYLTEKVIDPDTGEHGWRLAHHVVAESSLGRPLEPYEHVHHIDCDKTNNNPENLHVCTKSEHASAHASLNALLPGLVVDGVVRFNRETGRYERA